MKFLIGALLVAGLVFSACGEDEDSDEPRSPEPQASASTQPTAQPEPTAAAQPTATTAPAAAETPSDGNAPGIPELRGEIIETASGLRYIDEAAGSGATPAPTDCVRVHYTGWTTDGKKFDSSVDRGRPADFALNGVIPGWTEGVGSMQEGGKRRLIIPGDLAYGPSGIPQVGIGPNATLIFDVELIKVLGAPQAVNGRLTCPA